MVVGIQIKMKIKQANVSFQNRKKKEEKKEIIF